MTSVPPETIRGQLERILTSSAFRQSERMVRFLRFVVQHALDQRQEPLKEYVIALEAFDKGSDFDPKADPVVRVEARRLRAKLREYYATDGQADPVLIALPDRGYTPAFSWRDVPAQPLSTVARRRRFVLAAIGAILILAAAAAWLLRPRPRITAAGRRTVIAVLPFTGIGSTGENEYFSDGLTDEVINSLSAIEGLDVIARTSVFQFKGRGADVRTIARQLNATMLLEGSVRKEGDTVRVTTQLIDGSDGSHLWSQTLERRVTSVLEIQEDIAHAIATRLRLGMGSAAGRGATKNPDAFNLYLQGRHAWFHFAGPAAQKSISLFQQAVALDPDFAAAHAELAMAYALVTDMLALPSTELMPRAREAAAKALVADPNYAEGHVAMGAVKVLLEWDWRGAEREFRRALELNPNSYRARFDYPILYLRPIGRFSEAASQLRRVLDLDPVSPFVNGFLGRALVEAGRYDEALQHLKAASEVNPNYGQIHNILGEAYTGKAMCGEARQAFERSRVLLRDASFVLGHLGYVHARCGQRSEALVLLAELLSRKPVPQVDIARIYAGLGDKDRAFAALERAVAGRYSELVFLRGSPALGELRSDPRFDRLLFETMGLPR